METLQHSTPGSKHLKPDSDRREVNQTSYWLKDSIAQYPSLESNLSVDVAIVGAGITGLSAAYLCKKAGLSVALLEKHLIGAGDSGHTTAHLTYVTDRPLSELQKNFGDDHGAAVWDAGKAALDKIHGIIHEEEISCGFHQLSAFFHKGQGTLSPEAFAEEYRRAAQAGFEVALQKHTPLYGDYGIEYFHQALFKPTQYLKALAAWVNGGGSQIFESSEVTDFGEDPLTLKANGYTVSCGALIIATNSPLQATQSTISAALFQTKLYPYTSYVIRAELVDSKTPVSSYFDSADPYYYLRVDKHGEKAFAIFGGADVKTGQDEESEKRYIELATLLNKHLPISRVTHRWLGQVVETPDGLPYIGAVSDNCYVGTGYNGNGYTFGTLAGMMISEQILGNRSPWKELFHPDRKKLKGATWNYLKENLDYPYYLIKDRLTRTESDAPETLKPGEGKLLRINNQRVAAYRPPSGPTIFLSPVCTHLGCLVRWNDTDSSWECPCHGSRFKATGEVEAGPAESPLKKVEL